MFENSDYGMPYALGVLLQVCFVLDKLLDV